LNLNKASTAITGDRKRRVVAKARDFYPSSFASLKNSRSGTDKNGATINSNRKEGRHIGEFKK
jgi:hypothetical protein